MILPAILLASLLLQDSAQVAYAHDHPDSVRDSIRGLLAAQSIDSAEGLAHAYALAWRDSFFVREVARFAAWPEATRRTRIAADSLRRAGNSALGRSGVAAAQRNWRASLRRCESIADSACMGAALGNIGAGFYRAGDLDSATTYFERARAMSARAGDYRTQGNATGALASVAADRGELKQAADLYARAAELRLRTGDDRGAAADRNNLGLIAQNLGDLDGARQAFSDALKSNRAADRAGPAAVNLINLGNLASLQGDYPQAADHYREALALYRSAGDSVKAAEALHDLGLLSLQRGDYSAALENFTAALALYRQTNSVAEIIAVRRDIATAYAARGNLQGALIELERAERLAQARGSTGGIAIELALARADLETDFNDLAAASRGYTRAEQLARKAADSRARADAQRGQGLLLLGREDYAGARTQFVAALRTEEIAGDKRSAALTRLLLGYSDSRRGDTASARRMLTQSLDTLTALRDLGGQAAALDALADVAIQHGSPMVAESLYRQGLARAGSWQLHAGLADALRRQGLNDAAAREYTAAVRDIERAAGTLRQGERRAGFEADKWDVYAQFARVELARGRTDSAFELSETLRARQLLDLLSRGRVTPWQTNPANAAQVAQEQDYRRQITLLMRRLEGRSTGFRGPLASDSATGAVREALDRVQQAYGDLLRRVQADQPRYAALVTAAIAPAREVRAALPRDVALLEYLVSDSASLVFVVTSDTIAAIELGAGRYELAKLVEFTRSMLALPSATGSGESAWRAPLRRLYRYLIEPVEVSGLLAGKQGLIIAPHAELHYVPFAALLAAPKPTPGQYLIEHYRLTTVPSASVWLRLRNRGGRTGSGGRVLALAPNTAALPGSAAEVAAIQQLYGERAHALTGNDASKHALLGAAHEQEIIHFATYGVLNKDNPLFSFVELAPGRGDDGRLEVHEVFGLGLEARLVVLSACQTALSAGTLADVPSGDDWLGLVEAFHFAGAAKVMATLWPVEDRATADLMAQFYAGLNAGRSEAEALAEAQRATLRKRASAPPFYWAGFTLSGDDR
jgi:CHAT domain-containing protein/TolA-binding protein